MGKNLICIIGAGPAGMACAMELWRAKQEMIIIEKDDQVGGLAQTLTIRVNQDTFLTDLGPHRFFSQNQYLYDFVEDLIKEDWIIVNRKTRQYIHGKFYDYPIQPLQALKNTGMIPSLGMAYSYLKAQYHYKILNRPISTFHDYTAANFGEKLADFCMNNYTEKIWGIQSEKIHPNWARQRIQGLNIFSAFLNNLNPFRKIGPKSLIQQFYYPRYGSGSIYEAILAKISHTNDVLLKSYPTKIRHSQQTITSVSISHNDQCITIEPDSLVSSVPITHVLSLMDPLPPETVLQAARKLTWRSQVYLFLMLDLPSVTDDNWIYFPTEDIPFGRISEMKNFSQVMVPEGKTSLFVEYFVSDGDHISTMDDSAVYALTLHYLEKLKFIRRTNVIGYRVIRRSFVYPVYNLEYISNIKTIMEYTDSFSNLYQIGRPGRFLYTNQDHSLEMGILTARSILGGKRYNIDSVGSGNDYFEKGYLQSGNKTPIHR